MLNLIFTLVIGIVVLILFKIGYICYKYLRFCRLLRKLSVTTVPGHWLIGNLREDQIKDSKSYIDLVLKETNERNRKIILLWFGPFPSISITHPDTFKQLSKQVPLKARGSMDGYRFFEPWLGEGLLISGGKKWERNRKLLTPAFHFNILNGYVNVMNNVADILMKTFTDAAKNGEPVDVFPNVCRASLDTMLRCSLSYDEDLQSTSVSEYLNIVKRLSQINWERSLNLSLLSDTMFNLSSLGREFYKLCDKAHKFTGDIIESRRKELDKQQNDVTGKRRLDFLDILLTARDEHGLGLSAQEIQDEVDTFTFEGHDTTSSAISWTIFALAKHPVLQEKVFSEVRNIIGGNDSLSPYVFRHLLHFYFSTIAGAIFRATDKPIVLDGIEIPVGVSIWVQIYCIHHNKDVWPNHEVFDPERFSANQRDETDIYGFIPFSAGSRNCIGQVFAMNEIKITIAKLVKRFEFQVDPENEPVLLPDIIMRSQNGVHVKLIERKH
ncbi:cytochrome P450 4A7-like [Ruditapes philippinarum]|uniref:cytochrome P450 4A7-like n=1 Tax=Ruditapes philippinarum TaxID=129788 RepID=UPI00295A5967|nr:cytochrome P450 4A7-like [Ruditapes philippinarum]